MGRTLPILVVGMTVVVATGWARGRMTGRWEPSPSLQQAAERVEKVPTRFGGWRQDGDTMTLAEDEVKAAHLAGHFYRQYKEAKTGHVVTVLLLCGPSGPVAVHTPEQCYAAAGYEQVGSKESYVVKYGDAGAEAAVFRGAFRREGSLGVEELRISWCWNGKGQWQAPASPRWEFAGRPALYKLYVIRQVPPTRRPAGATDPAAESAADEPSAQFLRALLPELDAALFPTP